MVCSPGIAVLRTLPQPLDSGSAPSGASRNDAAPLLAVIRQYLLAGPAQPCAVLLEATQNSHVTAIHHGPAKARNVARARILALLRGRLRSHQNKRNDEEDSGHLIAPRFTLERDQILLRR
jgi:hypothetical protein